MRNVNTLVLVGIVALVLSVCVYAFAGSGDKCDRISVDGIVEAITYLVDNDPSGRHPQRGKTERIEEIATAICDAGLTYAVDPFLLTSMASFESNFLEPTLRLERKGKRKEKGLLQCGPDCARQCPHFMNHVAGQALCGARWLNTAYKECSTQKDGAALAYYASGNTCDPKSSKHVGWVVRRRLTRAARLRNLVHGGI